MFSDLGGQWAGAIICEILPWPMKGTLAHPWSPPPPRHVQRPTAQLQPDIISFSAAIGACKGQRWQQALHLFECMPQASVLPDVVSFNATISSCEKSAQWQQSVDLFARMCFARLPDVISFNATISSLGKAQQPQRALCLIEAMPTAQVQPSVTGR